jgi:hypothetical protein
LFGGWEWWKIINTIEEIVNICRNMYIIIKVKGREYCMGKPFIKIKLHSGVGGAPLGEKDLVLYYECDPNVKNIFDSDIISYDDAILKWANSCKRFQKGDLNEDFEFFKQPFELVFLNDDQIKKVHGY